MLAARLWDHGRALGRGITGGVADHQNPRSPLDLSLACYDSLTFDIHFCGDIHRDIHCLTAVPCDVYENDGCRGRWFLLYKKKRKGECGKGGNG